MARVAVHANVLIEGARQFVLLPDDRCYVFLGCGMRALAEAVWAVNLREQKLSNNHLRYMAVRSFADNECVTDRRIKRLSEGLQYSGIVTADQTHFALVDFSTNEGQQGRTQTLTREAILRLQPAATISSITQSDERLGTAIWTSEMHCETTTYKDDQGVEQYSGTEALFRSFRIHDEVRFNQARWLILRREILLQLG